MQKKGSNKFIFATAFIFTLFFNQYSYSVAAYIPQVLRECFASISQVAGKTTSDNFQELCGMIAENRVLTSDSLARSVAHEALEILENDDCFENKWRQEAHAYLHNYLDGLNNKSILCSLHGDRNALTTMPAALLTRSLQADAMSKDILYLSSQLTSMQNIEICGNVDINSDFSGLMPTYSTDEKLVRASLLFNANMLSNPDSSSPNAVFGTGVSSPVVTAWTMSSTPLRHMTTRAPLTTPVTIQFSIPTDFKRDEPVSLKVHFLVEKQGFEKGKARIQVDALYTGNNDQFDLSDTTHTDRSKDFTVKEPSNDNEFRHVYVSVPLKESHIKKNKFAMLTISRIQPHETEYAGDIFLVAAEFKYTNKEDAEKEGNYCYRD